MWLTSQRGAMFGLDARMAMLIFGLLSIIAGYYGYSRIATAKHAALIKELEDLDLAMQAYQADMGTFYLFTIEGESNGRKDMEALWDQSKVAFGFKDYWHGPYLHRETRDHRSYGRFSITYGQKDRKTLCTNLSDCYAWITLTDVPEEVWDVVNRYVDESSGDFTETYNEKHLLGRVHADALSDPRVLFYRSIKRPK